MKKKGIRMLAGIVAIGALSGTYLLLRMQNDKAEQEEEVAALGDVILEVDSADVTALSYEIGGETKSFVLVAKPGSWNPMKHFRWMKKRFFRH